MVKNTRMAASQIQHRLSHSGAIESDPFVVTVVDVLTQGRRRGQVS